MSDVRAPTFAEREGTKPLPTQLQLKQVSPEIRAKAWEIIYNSITEDRYRRPHVSTYYNRRWYRILADYWVQIDHRYADDCDDRYLNLVAYAKEKIPLPYDVFFEFIEFIVQHALCPEGIDARINKVLEECGCAYRIIDRLVVPIANPEVAAAVDRAFTDLSGYAGALAHLRKSAQNLSNGHYADSIRESIHAVESVALRVAPGSSTLGPALSVIEKSQRLHPALKKGFAALYGYTSDEEGIRHALIEEDSAQATENDALYMLGSCAAFASYLVNATRSLDRQ